MVLVRLLMLSTAITWSPAAVAPGTTEFGVETLPWLTLLPTSAIARIATGVAGGLARAVAVVGHRGGDEVRPRRGVGVCGRRAGRGVGLAVTEVPGVRRHVAVAVVRRARVERAHEERTAGREGRGRAGVGA